VLEPLLQEFKTRFGRDAELAARAPGRVNLIGEHTDYNAGLVMPCAIDRETVAVAARRDDSRWRVFSRERGEESCFDAAALGRRGEWVDYVQGVVFALGAPGGAARGLDLAIASEVPPESGLASSAALALATAILVDHSQGLGLGPRALALAAHRGESEFVGVGCGIMDHFASALGRDDAALRIDCRSLELTPVALPTSRIGLLIAHSGIRRALASHGYRDRRDECRRALEALRAAGLVAADAVALRDVGVESLPAIEDALEPPLARRVRHVVTENERVDAVGAALVAGDLPAVGALLRDGMRSLREDFEVSLPELDALCELGDAAPGVYGSRLTGAGFGGCTLHLTARDALDEAAAVIAGGFERRFGRRPPLLAIEPAQGAGRLEL
jgi:galactokinase